MSNLAGILQDAIKGFSQASNQMPQMAMQSRQMRAAEEAAQMKAQQNDWERTQENNALHYKMWQDKVGQKKDLFDMSLAGDLQGEDAYFAAETAGADYLDVLENNPLAGMMDLGEYGAATLPDEQTDWLQDQGADPATISLAIGNNEAKKKPPPTVANRVVKGLINARQAEIIAKGWVSAEGMNIRWNMFTGESEPIRKKEDRKLYEDVEFEHKGEVNGQWYAVDQFGERHVLDLPPDLKEQRTWLDKEAGIYYDWNTQEVEDLGLDQGQEGISPEMWQRVKDMRGEFLKNKTVEVTGLSRLMKKNAVLGASRGDGQGDLMLLYAFARLVAQDGSAVREGEFETVKDAQAWFAQHSPKHLKDIVLKGSMLAGVSRAKVLEGVQMMARASEQSYRELWEQYKGDFGMAGIQEKYLPGYQDMVKREFQDMSNQKFQTRYRAGSDDPDQKERMEKEFNRRKESGLFEKVWY